MSIKSENFSRREFAKLTGLALATIPFMSFVYNPLVKTALEPDGDLKVHLFSKHLQFLNYNDMSAAAANMGFNGLDLTDSIAKFFIK